MEYNISYFVILYVDANDDHRLGGGKRVNKANDWLPLTEAFYYILLSLYTAPAHGYAIMQQTEQMSADRVVLGAGTLYTALNTLLKKGLIMPSKSPSEGDSRRKVYAITKTGREVLCEEIERLQAMVQNGRKIVSRMEGMDE